MGRRLEQLEARTVAKEPPMWSLQQGGFRLAGTLTGVS